MKNIIRLGLSTCFALMMLFSMSFAQSTQTAPAKKKIEKKDVSIKLQRAVQAKRAPQEKVAVKKTVHANSAVLKKKDVNTQKTVKKSMSATTKKETPRKED